MINANAARYNTIDDRQGYEKPLHTFLQQFGRFFYYKNSGGTLGSLNTAFRTKTNHRIPIYIKNTKNEVDISIKVAAPVTSRTLFFFFFWGCLDAT